MRTDFLFGMPSWLSGVSRTLDLGAEFDAYNDSKSPLAADAKALYSDWRIVGESLADVMKAFRREPQTQSR